MKISKNTLLAIFFIYQLFSTVLIGIGVWPQEIVYINLVIQLAAILLFDIEHAVYSVILSLPFYLVLPNPYTDTLSAWRFVFLALFIKYIFHSRKTTHQTRFFEWDKYLKYLAIIALVSLSIAEFKVLGLKKIIFVLNTFLLYAVIANVFLTKEKIIKLLKVVAISLGAIIALGFVQYFTTFYHSQYYFWQYWATFVSRVYYGEMFSDTAIYSNSWFSFAPESPPTLRMFSIMPSSHAFAVSCIFLLPVLGSLWMYVQEKWKKNLFLLAMFFTVFALLLSGTRGVWVGIVAPIVLIAYFFFKRYSRRFQKIALTPIIIFFLLVIASPYIQRGINAITSGNGIGNFLQRAGSIYDLQESSNKGRIMIWGKTLEYALKNPFLGTGYGNFIVSLQDPAKQNADQSLEQISSEVEETFNLPKKYITGHSLYLDILAELGIIGLIAFFWYLKTIVLKHWNFFKSHYLYSEDSQVFFVFSFALAMAWLFAYSVFDGTLLSDRVLMYFFVLLALSGSIMKSYQRN